MNQITEIFASIEAGDPTAADRLLPVVYDELRRIAASKMARESPGQTLQTTALVNEAWLRLTGIPLSSESDSEPMETKTEVSPGWQSRGHFFAAAAEAMRRILIDNARRKGRLKRGGDHDRIEMDRIEPAAADPDVDLIGLDEALTRFEAQDPEKARVVKLRYFAGLTVDETATALEISPATVKRHWSYARAWLMRELQG